MWATSPASPVTPQSCRLGRRPRRPPAPQGGTLRATGRPCFLFQESARKQNVTPTYVGAGYVWGFFRFFLRWHPMTVWGPRGNRRRPALATDTFGAVVPPASRRGETLLVHGFSLNAFICRLLRCSLLVTTIRPPYRVGCRFVVFCPSSRLVCRAVVCRVVS